MSRYEIVLTDGTVDAGIALGTPDEVYTYLASTQSLKSLKVHSADDITWPTADECPNHN
jgi:hypothetical protein